MTLSNPNLDNQKPLLDAPPSELYDITPSDTANLSVISRAIYVGQSGDLKVDAADVGTVTFKNVPVGWHSVRAKKVYATGTDALYLILGR